METREEHMKFCKKRALEYLDAGNLVEAVASMVSDLSKHPETSTVGEAMGPLGLFDAASGDAHRVRQ